MVDTVGRITFAGCQDVDDAPEYRTIPVRNAPSQVLIDEAYDKGVKRGMELAMERIKDSLDNMR